MEAKIGGHGQYVGHPAKTTSRSLAYPRHVRRKTPIAAPHCRHNPRPLPALTLVPSYTQHSNPPKPDAISPAFARHKQTSQVCCLCGFTLSLSLSLSDLSQHYKTSLLKLAPLRIRPRKATRGRYGSHKKKMRPRTFAYRPVRLDSTRRRSHKPTLRDDVKSAMGPFLCCLLLFSLTAQLPN